MSYYFIDIEKDIDFSKIIIGKKINIDDNTNRYYIYYLDDKPKEIYIKLPSIRLIYNYQNMKYSQIKLPIYPLWEKTNKLISFIKKFQNHIKSQLDTDSEFSSCLDKYNDLKVLKLYLVKNLKIKSCLNDITFSDFKTSGEIEMIIRIPYIYEKNNSYGLSIFAYQVKYNPPIEQLNIDFWDDDEDKKPNMNIILKSRQIVEEYKQPVISVPPQVTENKSLPSLIPSMKDLQLAIKKLKKIE